MSNGDDKGVEKGVGVENNGALLNGVGVENNGALLNGVVDENIGALLKGVVDENNEGSISDKTGWASMGDENGVVPTKDGLALIISPKDFLQGYESLYVIGQ